jgi:hypothetical protein
MNEIVTESSFSSYIFSRWEKENPTPPSGRRRNVQYSLTRQTGPVLINESNPREFHPT